MADQNSIFYKLGLAVKAQVAAGAFNTANSAFTGTTTAENLTLSDDLIVNGNLQVLGEQTVTKINQTDLDIKDNFIGLNRGASTAENNTKDIGFYFERGNKQDAASFVFDEDDGKFVMGFLQASGGSGGFETTTTTSDGNFVTSLSGDLADSIVAAVNEGGLNVDLNSSVSDVTDANFMGTPLAYTVLEIYVSHPDIDAASSGPWMDGHANAAEFKTSFDALDFSTGGNLSVSVVKGTSPWDADHPVLVYINDGTNQFEVTSSTVFNVDAFAAELSLVSVTSGVAAGSAAPTADAANVAANAAPLKVASLEINDATDGALSLGDFADFEAALAAV